MSEPREQQEPSMEEILSSIRRIIADEEADDSAAGTDDDLGAAEARAEAMDDDAEALAQDADDDDAEDVLELTKVVRDSGEVVDLQPERPGDEEVAEATADQPIPAEHESSDGDADDELELAPPENAPADAPVAAAAQDPTTPALRKDHAVQTNQAHPAQGLVSSAAASVATGAFAKLSDALHRTPEEESVADHTGRTVEQFVEDALRPMLKAWLDEHLPEVVERMVEKEIQKIARRAELV